MHPYPLPITYPSRISVSKPHVCGFADGLTSASLRKSNASAMLDVVALHMTFLIAIDAVNHPTPITISTSKKMPYQELQQCNIIDNHRAEEPAEIETTASNISQYPRFNAGHHNSPKLPDSKAPR
jgi:hypothetical protein